MSKKPPKKTDMNKSWMQPRMDRRRLIFPERHLIVTEGTKTEPAYFGAMKEVINRKYRDRLQVEVYGEGVNTVSLFERAKEIVRRSTINSYQHVWLVYDTDDFSVERINETKELCDRECSEEIKFHALWSNQCIELWFLLHFSYMHSDLHRNEYWPKLTECFDSIGAGEYEKNRADIYEVLLPYMDSAIKNAEQLDRTNQDKTPAQSAPGTKVFELVKLLRPYLIGEKDLGDV